MGNNALNWPDFTAKGDLIVGQTAPSRPVVLHNSNNVGDVIISNLNDTPGLSFVKGFNGFYLSGVNAKNTGAVTFATTPASGNKFYPTHAILSVTADNSISVGASISIGTNASSYDNIFSNTAYTTLTTTGNYQLITISGVLNAIPNNTQIFLNINTAATGTSITMACVLLGTWGI